MKEKTEKKRIGSLFKILISAAAAIYAAGIIGDNIFTDTFYTIPTDKISGRIRIVNVSDLHNKLWGKDQHILINEIKKLSPDIILMSGDAVSDVKNYNNALTFITKAVKIAPVYYSTGNHEHASDREDLDALMEIFRNAGANVLIDESTVVCPDGKNSINVIGLDNYSLDNGTLNELISGLDNGNFTVVLAHRPQYIHNYTAENCDAVFCGHAHGGQIRIPFVGGLYAPSYGLFPDYTEGMYTENGTSVIISRGMANTAVVTPRFFNSPELIVADAQGK